MKCVLRRKKLRSGKFDLALVLPNSPRSALETWLAGIPQRIGCARPWRNFFLTDVVPARAESCDDAEAFRCRNPTAGGCRCESAVTSNSRVSHERSHKRALKSHEYLHLVAALGASPEPMPPQLVVTPDEMKR